MTKSLQEITIQDFSSISGQDVEVLDELAGKVATSLRITQVTELTGQAGYRTPFSVILEGPKSAALEQGTYMFRHQQFGSLPIFIVPIAEIGEFRRYQIIFS